MRYKYPSYRPGITSEDSAIVEVEFVQSGGCRYVYHNLSTADDETETETDLTPQYALQARYYIFCMQRPFD